MFIFLFLFSSNCFATLITSDDVYDDGTFEWLHFDFTHGMTSAVSLSTYTGDGFRLATVVEAQDLINDWFGTSFSLDSNEYDPLYSVLATEFFTEFTATYIDRFSLGLVADGGLFGVSLAGGIFIGDNPIGYGEGGVGEYFAGYMMVRDSSSDVPEPSTLAILAFSLMGLASRRQYKQAFNSF